MLPKSKRAKRRNRHGSGFQLYTHFRWAEKHEDITTILGRRTTDGKFWFGWDSIKMRGGVIVYG